MDSGTVGYVASLDGLRAALDRRSMLATWIAVLVATFPFSASGQSGWSNYGLFESQRRASIARQLGIQEDLRAQSGLSSRLFPGLQPYSLEAIYAGLATPAGARSWGSPYVFEPWPTVPGDIYGRQFDFGTPTPLGHVTTYTSPNSYVYEPYYSVPLLAPLQRHYLSSGPLPELPPELQSPTYPPTPSYPAPGPSIPEELPPPAAEGLREF